MCVNARAGKGNISRVAGDQLTSHGQRRKDMAAGASAGYEYTQFNHISFTLRTYLIECFGTHVSDQVLEHLVSFDTRGSLSKEYPQVYKR